MTRDEIAGAREYAENVKNGFLSGSTWKLTKMVLALVAEIELRDRLAAADALIGSAKQRKAGDLPPGFDTLFGRLP